MIKTFLCPGCGKHRLKRLAPFGKLSKPCSMYTHLNRNDIIAILTDIPVENLNKVLVFYGHKQLATGESLYSPLFG